MAQTTHQTNPAGRRSPRSETQKAGVRLEDRPQVELYELAQQLGIGGYSELSRAELIEAIRRR
jgi:hypothetical protein